MKKFYCKMSLALLVLVIMTKIIRAQDVDTTYAARMNYIFQHLDKAKVPYGLLKDMALEMAELKYYRGTILMDSNRVFVENFRDIYRTLYTSKIHPSAGIHLPNPDVVDSIWYAKRKPGQVTMSGLYYKYSRFADDAPNKVTIVNDQIYDKQVNGVWQNPYQSEQVIGFASADADYAGLNFNLLLPAELWLSNQKAQVSKIQVDAGDGLGYRTLSPNIYLPVLYADSGIKVLKFKVLFTDNTYVQSHSLLHITNSPYVFTPTAPIPVDQEQIVNLIQQPGNDSFMPPACITGNAGANGVEKILMTSTESFNGKYAKGLITVQYAQPDHKIHKPLIVVEGFDAGIYSKPEDIRGDNKLEDFKDYVYGSTALNNLLFNLPQYDIIYIDWQNGTEDLRLNALLLKTVIQCVNNVKVPNNLNVIEKNVVLGSSMGGVIARYTLKKMEDQGLNHDTRLYISHDAPHQGANVPLGFQAAILDIRSAFVKPAGEDPNNFSLAVDADIKQAYLANTTAAKQMMVNRLKGNKFQGYTLDDAVHIAWQTELAGLGYPQQCRNIAISNGSECGTPFTINPGDHLIYFDGYYKSKFLTDIITSFTSPLIGAWARSWKVFFYSFIPGSHKYSFHIEANTLEANGVSNLIYKNKVQYMKKILWFIPVTETLFSNTVFAPAGLKTVENFPGGYFSLMEQDLVKNDASDNAFYKGSYVLNIKSKFSFIPTTSALDIGKGLTPLTNSDYYSSYVGASPPPAPKNTPFDNFITAFSSGVGLNEEHISFTPRNGKWLADELNQPQQPPLANCAYFCTFSPNSILGPATLCGTTTYSINNLPVGATITWTAWGSLQVNGINNQNTVSIKQVSNDSGTLFAKISSSCGDKTVSRTISSSGAPAYQEIQGQYTNLSVVDNPSLINNADFYPVNAVVFSIPSIPGVSYQWTVNGSIWGGNQGHEVVVFAPECGYGFPSWQIFSAQVKMTNACGSTTVCKEFKFYCTPNKHLDALGSCSMGEPVEVYSDNDPFIFYPNPASDELKITFSDNLTKDSEMSFNAFEVKLYDAKGKKVKSEKSKNNQKEFTLDTHNLPNGLYYLHIQQGDQLIKKQVIIQH